jgi:hypothetical protein
MKPRQLGGCISRADAIFVWVPYASVEYEDEPEEDLEPGGVVTEVLDPEHDDSDPGDPDEEFDDEPEEIGVWLGVTKVQARELVADACTSEIEDLEITAEELPTGLYIGLGPLP